LTSLTFTLLSDGSSDRALIPVLQWLLRQNSSRDFEAQWAELRGLRKPPKALADRIHAALALYPCDLLFVHRDAESLPRAARVEEIRKHLGPAREQTTVCVVPIRMQETWFLFNEAAIRRAADNPQGTMKLALPPLPKLEDIPDPKDVLCSLLAEASGLRVGRLHRFFPEARIHRLSELIEDFSPLRRLQGFQALEKELRSTVAERSWL